jgi:hypothetical protein
VSTDGANTLVVLPAGRPILVTPTPDHRCQPVEFVHVAVGDHQRVVAIVPLIVLFLAFQRHIVRSIVVTALK